jgi:catechol 2,3-dioxygenase-like lactoylglutathione lyase family enzyme
MTVDVIGIDHVYLTVAALERSESFYDQVLLGVLGFRKSRFRLSGVEHVQYYNRRFGIVLRPAAAGSRTHDAYSPGLHHLCLRVESAAEVTTAAAALREIGVDATDPRAYREYAEDYVATFFCDPDGIRLEVTNFREERRRRNLLWETDPV